MVFFIVEQNTLNNQYMVHSKCDQLPQCYAFADKKSAKNLCEQLNKIANRDYIKYKPALTWAN